MALNGKSYLMGNKKQQNKYPKKVIALAGNPNVGKSTLFNEMTGLRQHTGNWAGKTVVSAKGEYYYKFNNYVVVDLPGTYSLLANSAEESVARDFICFGGADAVVVVVDATCVERNLNLVLQCIEISENVVVCLNLMDEARKKNIVVDAQKLSEALGVPVVCATARSGKGINKLLEQVYLTVGNEAQTKPIITRHIVPIEEAIALVEPQIKAAINSKYLSRFIAMRLLENDELLNKNLCDNIGVDLSKDDKITKALKKARIVLQCSGITKEKYRDMISACLVNKSERITKECVAFDADEFHKRDRKLDNFFTGKLTGIPVMILMVMLIFWLTITFSNYPSSLLQEMMNWIAVKLHLFAEFVNSPLWLSGVLIDGVFRVLGWVVAVMLPPMAIFFPLFTLMEDFGYLPRVAFNLDSHFKKANTCGKQALTICQGFGCNAVAVTGARIIDSPRERLIAIITNNFTPCNGRFPLLIAIISMFFIGSSGGFASTILSSLLLTVFIIFSIFMSFTVSRILSKTLLKGVPSSFTLELPPYRKPQIGKVLIRSLFDRTLFVLGRAVIVAAPAGMLIWLLANITVGDGITALKLCSDFFDPFARLLGMDGTILFAFILGFPANEIVIPIVLMSYMSKGQLVDYESLVSLKTVLVDNGWTWVTAISVMLFSIMHWPCSTTCLTIKKETSSIKWTVVSFLVPTVCGIVICMFFNLLANLFI